MDKFKRIILVTGTPGVGKTSVSRILATKLNARHVELGELVKQKNLISGVDETRGTLIADIDKVSSIVKKIIKESEQDVIIDGHYAVEVVPPKEINFVIVLRRDPDELKTQLKGKGLKKEIRENLAAEILDVCLIDAIQASSLEKIYEIDTSGREFEEVVKDIITILADGRKSRVGLVDWLGKLDKEGRLNEFF